MPVSEENRVTPITDDSLTKMPRVMAKRLRPGLSPEMEPEFLECVSNMGYESYMASPMMRQVMFELFIGGWGAKIRQLKRKKRERDS